MPVPNRKQQYGNKGGNRGGYNQPSLDVITSAYNFVPLSNQIFPLPEKWIDQTTHDIPLKDGVCGTLSLEINTHTPLLIGQQNATNEREIKPFYLPDGSLSIPGSSLRGMIRNVLEIVSFGKMRLVDDKRYSIRDLTAKFYTNQLTSGENQKYKPKSRAGWLRFNKDKSCWQIIPCDYARVERDDIINSLKPAYWVKITKYDRPDAKQKYASWLKNKNSLKIDFDATEEKFHPHSQGKQLFYSKVTSLGSGSQQGYLVFTGQPAPQKHMEFIFKQGDESNTFDIPENIMQGFLHIYNDSKHWHYLKQSKKFPQGIPVFYLTDTNTDKITSLGLSQMYRLAYKHSIGEVIDACNQKHRQNNALDLVELIFGTVDEDNGKHSLKSRVSFSLARQPKDDDAYKSDITQGYHETVLNEPKPSYYPNYIVQDHLNGKLKGRDYTTFMDDGVKIRGWKRYPVRPREQVNVTPLDPKTKAKSKAWVKLRPIKEDQKFKAKMRFHNLRKEELGALVYCLTWGGQSQLRHAIGMGKPFGFGQLSIKINENESHIIHNNEQQQIQKEDYKDYLKAAQKAFIDMLEDKINWKNSPQIKQLLAMADPQNAPGKPGGLEPLKLERGKNNNQFVNAKKANLVLLDYIDNANSTVSTTASAVDESSPEGKWFKQTVATLAAQHKAPEKNIILGKTLATEWQKISEESLKQAALKLIKAYWEENGGWEKGTGSKKKAFAIYQDGEE